MQFQFDMTSNLSQKPAAPVPEASVGQMVLGVLQQMLDFQRQSHQELMQVVAEQLNHARAIHVENITRWRNILGRWETDYPELPGNCKQIYPVMEKTYLHMLNSLSQELAEQGEGAFDNEYELQDFLDKNGAKIGQFAHLLNVIGPICEVATQNQNNPPV